MLPEFHLRNGSPDFQDLPWDLHLSEWSGNCSRLEEAPHGLSRHPVVFVNYAGLLYALKELPDGAAKKEFEILHKIQEMRLPSITPIGYAQFRPETSGGKKTSILITRYLDFSLPYRSLFIQSVLDRYREHLLDAMAGLLVQLHMAGVFWGDSSLSNTLFRRDAGTIQAYLVDAETVEFHHPRLSPSFRHEDLQIMEENVDGEINDLLASGEVLHSPEFNIAETGAYIRQSYQELWQEVTREQIIHPHERYRIQERIKVLNDMGFSVGSIEMHPTTGGDSLRLRVIVTDRNFHQNQLYSLTGLEAEEMQARQIMNEIMELKAELSNLNKRSTPLSVTAYHWLEYIYKPVVRNLQPLISRSSIPELGDVELYWQVLEHKWFLSERAGRDVGHQAAVEDYAKRFHNNSA
jgi:hypothetical protein